ncbi:hypothetical protein AGDE_03506 [Angomonas deanei]|nr:hypothetical protein AGDE_03506 [Angomonas deanei]|eukprot:EPY40422.1 hypothetical protein AGDE_03506 [Angomonas deanei]
MRAIGDCFSVTDQSVLNPFQLNTVIKCLKVGGILVPKPSAVVPTDEDAISPQSLLEVLKFMAVNHVRDERKMKEVVKAMSNILEEFTTSELLDTLHELGNLQYAYPFFVEQLVKRVLASGEELTTMDLSGMFKALGKVRGVRPATMRRVFAEMEKKIGDMDLQDYRNVLEVLQMHGSTFAKELRTLTNAGLERVETMDAATLLAFLKVFALVRYDNRIHIDIYGDAILDVISDLGETNLVDAFVATQHLDLLSEEFFRVMTTALLHYMANLTPQYVSTVADVCSRVPHDSSEIMSALLQRVAQCVRFFSPVQLSRVVEVIGDYPPAKEDEFLVMALGKQCFLRMEVMDTQHCLPGVMRGLASLGYRDPAFYVAAVQLAQRYGFKSFSAIEGSIIGLTFTPDEVPPSMVKIITSNIASLAKTLSLAEVRRAYHYMTVFHVEEDYVYRVLATRVLQFVKEINSEVPEDIQVLLQRGTMSTSR